MKEARPTQHAYYSDKRITVYEAYCYDCEPWWTGEERHDPLKAALDAEAHDREVHGVKEGTSQ